MSRCGAEASPDGAIQLCGMTNCSFQTRFDSVCKM